MSDAVSPYPLRPRRRSVRPANRRGLVPAPPASLATPIPRARVAALFDGEWQVVVLVAPAGAGKSVAAGQWAERCGLPVAAVALDGLDDHAALTRVLDATHSLFPAVPAVDVLDTSGLVRAVVRASTDDDAAALIVDCPQPLDDSPVWEAMSELVDGLAPRLRVVVVSRADPPLPIIRWRAAGIVRVVRLDDLSFDDDEAIALAAATGRELVAAAVVELNRRVEGWPLALALALMAAGDGRSPDDGWPGPVDRSVDELMAEVVAELPPRHREIARALSVFEWFDDTLAAAVLGPHARPAVADLRRRHLVEPAGPGVGLRFHGLVRRRLDAEMCWHDPVRHAGLHRRAAEHWRNRGDWDLAYRHLGSLRERAAVDELVVEPARALADRGDRAGLDRLLAALPRTDQISDAAVALGLAAATMLGGDRRPVERWVARAEAIGLDRPGLAARAGAVRAGLALLDGRIGEASSELDGVALAPRADRDDLVERLSAQVGVRVALIRGRTSEAQGWIDRLGALDLRPAERGVTLAAVQAWHDSLVGLTHRAAAAATAAVERAVELGGGSQHGASDAATVAAWALLRTGDLAGAERMAARARCEAMRLGFDWHLVRSAEVAAHVHLACRRPAGARDEIARVRSKLAMPDTELARSLAVVDAAARWWLGSGHVACTQLDGLLDRSQARLIRAAIAVECGDDDIVGELVDQAAAWPLPERIEAELLVAVADGDASRLLAVVEDASAIGLMLPFLRQGRRVDVALLALSLETTYPALISHLRSAGRSSPAPARVGRLTSRERSILALLPSHLTYGEIADHLDLSVNTVKGNLKSIYRKLEVTARADAVDVARRSGVIGPIVA